MKSKTQQKPTTKNNQTSNATDNSGQKNGTGSAPASGKGKFTQVAPQRKNPHGIPDYRLEVPNFHTVEEWTDGKLHYNVKGDFSAPAPSVCESKYLTKEQSIAMYRYMVLNRKMEQ